MLSVAAEHTWVLTLKHGLVLCSCENHIAHSGISERDCVSEKTHWAKSVRLQLCIIPAARPRLRRRTSQYLDIQYGVQCLLHRCKMISNQYAPLCPLKPPRWTEFANTRRQPHQTHRGKGTWHSSDRQRRKHMQVEGRGYPVLQRRCDATT